jgi:exodeoxyribonuclease VII large subunit
MTVSDLTGIIKELLEGSFPLITVEGEISNFRPSSTGHIYFTLKDEHASISAVLFKGKSRYLSFNPKDGMKIRAKGSLSVYAQRGSYQIVIDSMEETGSGDILKLIEQRKRALAEEGLFDSERKQNIPYFPRCIGVVTSPTGAALRDVLQILNRRNPKVSVIILPCPVQGSDAGKIIAKQIDIANMHKLCDVLIVGRGGGSLEDLLPFSEEEVVRSIAASKIPVISAVGHEIDWALSDYAADVRAPTPSAAAELAVPPLDEIEQTLENYIDSFEQTITHKLEHTKAIVRSFSSDNLELRFRSIEQPLLQRFDDAKEDLLEAMQTLVRERRQALQMAVLNLESLNPLAILERGFSVVTDAQTGKVITGAEQTKTGAVLTIRPYKGSITAEVLHTNN